MLNACSYSKITITGNFYDSRLSNNWDVSMIFSIKIMYACTFQVENKKLCSRYLVWNMTNIKLEKYNEP